MATVTGNVVDIERRRIYGATVSHENGRITAIRATGQAHATYLLPGFIDAHVHVESSMLPPSEFARLACVHGTVATVSDPHEIANVLGAAGVEYMIADGRRTPFKFCFGAPSCVPATPFETAGGRLDAPAVERLLARPDVGYLSEVMNFPGVIGGDPDLRAMIAAARRAGKPVDGHAPGLRGDAAGRYFGAGIQTDHECVALEEAIEKIALGVRILIREGSAARNFDALSSLLKYYPEHCMLCSDDKHPNDLERGHIDRLVARAVATGADPFDALQAACVNPVRHYHLPVGLLRDGDPADFIEVHDLRDFRVLRTWIDGGLVARDGAPLLPRVPAVTVNRFEARERRAGEFAIAGRSGRVRVIEVQDGQLVTGQGWRDAARVPRLADDVLKIAVADRYGADHLAVGFIHGFGLKRGAIASSVAHDSHNIVAVGADDESLCRAVNAVVRAKGGLVVVAPGADDSPGAWEEHLLPLPIAGLMSDLPGSEVAGRYARLDARAKDLGCTLRAPFMTLSFMALPVIPALKLTDRGLFDVNAFRPVDLFE